VDHTVRKFPFLTTRTLNTSPTLPLVPQLRTSQLFPTLDPATSGSTLAPATTLPAGTTVPTTLRSPPPTPLTARPSTSPTDQGPSQDSSPEMSPGWEMCTLRTSALVKLPLLRELPSMRPRCQESWDWPMAPSRSTTCPPSLIPAILLTRVSPSISTTTQISAT